MSDSPLMLGVSGLRGIVGESLTPEVVVRYAAVFGSVLRERSTLSTVVVGRDGRRGGEGIYHAAISGLLSVGCNVIPIGVVMTPTLAVAVDETSSEAGLMITASHNPGEWNGLKLLLTDEIEWPEPDEDPDHVLMRRLIGTERAAAPPLSIANSIIHTFEQEQPFFQDSIRVGRVLPCLLSVFGDPVSEHAHKVWGAVVIGFEHEYDDQHRDRPLDGMQVLGRQSKKWRVVLDSVNASGGPAAEKLIHLFHAEAIQLFGDNSGVFPHTPEPTAENLSGEGGLCDAVPGLKADVGFAQDPDGDRLAIVDENGRYIGEEYTLVLAAMSILEARSSAPPPPVGELSPKVTEGASAQTPSDRSAATSPVGDGGGESDTVICVNLSTSRMIDDVAAKYGARVVRTAVGEANVVEAMKKLKREGKDVILGGEGNGGVIWPEVTYVRDSLGAMALTLSLMTRTGKTVSELVSDVPSYAIVKRKQPLAKKEDARPTIEKLTAHYSAMGKGVRVDTQDGVRIDFEADRAWVHVRASNTEPILRLIGEAPTREKVEAVLDEVQRLVDGG